MKAGAVFPGRRKVEVVTLDEPKITSPSQVKLRMLEVGVCGTDRELCDFDYGIPPDGCEFLVLGHESLGEVEETGAAVSRFRPGDLVAPMVRRPCPHAECTACAAGHQDFCYTGDFRERGIKRMHGFMTEFVVDDEKYMKAVPRDLREVAVLVEPLTIAEKALIQIRAIQQRLPWRSPFGPGQPAESCSSAVVLGAGPIGLLGAMMLVNAGFRTYVYSREHVPHPRADVAQAIGAHYVSAQEQTVGQLAALVGNIDVVYEATGASQMALELLEKLGYDGLFVFTGVPRHGQPVSIDAGLLMRNLVLKNQAILGTVNAGPEAFQAAIQDLGAFHRRWPAAVRSLITRRYPIEEFRQPIFERAGIKNIIVLDGRS